MKSGLLAAPVLPEILGGNNSCSAEELVAANVALLLGGKVQALVAEVGSYKKALFGEAAESKPPEGQGFIDQRLVLEDLGVYEACYFKHDKGGEFNFKTTRGYNNKAQTPGASGYKHYLSLDLSSSLKLELGTRLYRELAERAIANNIPFASKHWTEHAYDAQLIYTVGLSDTAGIAGILADIYPDYQDTGLLLSVPRIFQGSIRKVDPNQAGWVREDLPGMLHSFAGHPGSHSRRLEKLGRDIDALGIPEPNTDNVQEHLEVIRANLTSESFAAAALASWMHPARPYLTVVPV